MPAHKNIYLTGFMGCGKTTVGWLLAKTLGRRFIDTDALIEKQSQKSIRQIFADEGEAHFRRLEARLLRQIARKKDLVVSLGGGVPVDPQNRRLLKKGHWVFLKAPLSTLKNRVKGTGSRPLAANAKDFARLYKSRLGVYQKACVTVDARGRPRDVCQRIIKELRPMKTVTVALPKKAYSIHISPFDLNHSVRELKKHLKEDRIFILTNHRIKKLYRKELEKALKGRIRPEWISIPDGERHKTLATCERILTALSKKGAHRHSAILALGGGVVGDIAGFVAATYMRGIDYFQMPTTLLAQVDASVGGKTGVDLATGKNLVGAFYQPRAVFIHTEFLKTLPKREVRCGLAEVIKYAVVWDAKFFAYLKSRMREILDLNPAALAQIIERSCQIKAMVVARDEKESGTRAILNFGHTLGHAIEVIHNFKRIKHGEAIAMGMVFAARLSYQLGYSHRDHTGEITDLLTRCHLPTKWPRHPRSRYKKAILADKKGTGKTIRFILIKKIGKVAVVPLEAAEILKWL